MQKRDFVGLADTGAVCHCKRDLQRMKETLTRPTCTLQCTKETSWDLRTPELFVIGTRPPLCVVFRSSLTREHILLLENTFYC